MLNPKASLKQRIGAVLHIAGIIIMVSFLFGSLGMMPFIPDTFTANEFGIVHAFGGMMVSVCFSLIGEMFDGMAGIG